MPVAVAMLARPGRRRIAPQPLVALDLARVQQIAHRQMVAEMMRAQLAVQSAERRGQRPADAGSLAVPDANSWSRLASCATICSPSAMAFASHVLKEVLGPGQLIRAQAGGREPARGRGAARDSR